MRGEVRSTDGATIRWLETGSGPSLVLVPGGLGGEDAFDPLVAYLSTELRCVTMARRGKGFSDDPPGYSYEREYDDIAAVLDSVGPPRLVFGHSSGAICALGAALHAGADKLVVVEPPLPLTGPVLDPKHAAGIEAALARDEPDEAVLIGLRHGIRMNPEAIEARQARPGWPAELRRGAGWVREFAELNRLPLGVERYRAIEAPTLLMYGTATQDHHREAVEALAEALPNAEVAAFAGYGHDVPNAAAAEVAAVVLEFLRR
jgi:pimeloyl-ACP methyl ester carboxylesterase